MVIVFGILFHYILPQLRKQLPWLLFSEPLIKQADYSLFEPTGKREERGSIEKKNSYPQFQKQRRFYLLKNYLYGLYFSRRIFFYHVLILVHYHTQQIL
jgi:hypothetical protein